MKKYVHTKETHNVKDAKEIVPYIIRLFNPKSIIDVGCGLGTFLKIFNDYGINDIVGVEGDWLDVSKILVPKDNIIIADLEKKVDLNRKFDLAICLEVAEHLSFDSAEPLIETLTNHSDTILFSAAVPNQGGYNHINEQWIEFWQQLFEKYDYYLYDLLRSKFWNNKNIFWWYRQNMIVAIRNSENIKFPKETIANLIHPEHYILKVNHIEYLKTCLKKILAGEIELELAEEILEKCKIINSKNN